MKLKKPKLITQIFLGMVLGILIGHFFPEFGQKLQVLSDIFLRLIKMIIAPLVFCTLVVGIAKVGDFKAVGRIGVKTLIYFQGATILALSLGLVLVNLFKPGILMNLTPAVTGSELGIQPQPADIKSFVNHVIPSSVVDAMAKNEILPIVFFAIFFGIAAGTVQKKQVILDFFDGVSHIMFKITNYIMGFAPFGVLGAISAVIGKQGLSILSGYFYLIICFYGGLLFFVVVLLGLIAYAVKINLFKLLSAIKEPVVLAFSTASSESAFPKLIEVLERFGCSNRIISFVLPLGYSFNLDGSIMYMTFATVFIAQAYHIDLSMAQQLTMMMLLIVTSKGMAGVPRASLVVIAGALASFNIPTEGLLLLLGVDQILDMGRSATNVVGNAVATCVVSKWEKEFKPIPVGISVEKLPLN